MLSIDTASWPEGTLELAVVFQLDSASDNRPFVNWAVDALVAGFDTPSLRVLAGLDLDGEPLRADVYPAFAASLSELGIRLPDASVTGRLYVRHVAQAIVAGAIAPRDGAELIHARVVSPLEHPPDLMPWCYVWEGNSIDCTLLGDNEIDEEIIRLAKKSAS